MTLLELLPSLQVMPQQVGPWYRRRWTDFELKSHRRASWPDGVYVKSVGSDMCLCSFDVYHVGWHPSAHDIAADDWELAQ